MQINRFMIHIIFKWDWEGGRKSKRERKRKRKEKEARVKKVGADKKGWGNGVRSRA